VSSRMLAVTEERRAVNVFGRRLLEGHGLGPDACDFMFGNPQEPPLRGLVEALIRHAEPRDVHWFGYQKYDPAAREAVARSLRQSRGLPYEAADVAITAGGFGAIAAALLAVLEVGDEVLYPRPGWFNYGPLTRGAAGTPVPVDLTPGSFDLNVEAIAGAIGTFDAKSTEKVRRLQYQEAYRAAASPMARVCKGMSGGQVTLCAGWAFARTRRTDRGRGAF
jgi:aspartate aminotransferase